MSQGCQDMTNHAHSHSPPWPGYLGLLVRLVPLPTSAMQEFLAWSGEAQLQSSLHAGQELVGIPEITETSGSWG